MLKKIGTEMATFSKEEDSYSLIEVVMSIFVMGFVLMVINLVIISLVRISYDTDSRMRVRQGVEFALEVVRREIKSSDPASVDIQLNGQSVTSCTDREDINNIVDCKLLLTLSESGEVLTFDVDELKTGKEKVRYLKLDWSDRGRTTHLTSTDDMNVKEVTYSLQRHPLSGSTELTITVLADSRMKRSNGDPVIQDFYKQAKIISRGTDLD